MAHFARCIEVTEAQQALLPKDANKDNYLYVVNVHTVDNMNLLDELGVESEQKGIDFLKSVHKTLVCEWKQTSFSSSIRHKYAGVGDFYDKANDMFISPRPFPSWVLNEKFDYEAPSAYPTDGKKYAWDEENLMWKEIVLA
jgi:hypothetical protein